MKYINLSELFRQPDWPETLTQEQHQRLVAEKLQRAQLYNLLQSGCDPHFQQGENQCSNPLQ